MTPRLPSSKKWTTFPPDYIEQIKDIFEQTFREYLQQTEVIVEGRIYGEEILLRIGLLKKGHLRQDNFEASISYKADKDRAMQKISDGIDLIASVVDHFFSNIDEENPEFYPTKWEACEEGSIYFRYSTVNTRLEAEADAILGVADQHLVHEQSETEDALDHSLTFNEEELVAIRKAIHDKKKQH